MIIPFSVLNVPESQQWIGKGVQENLIADLGRSGAYSPLAFQGQVVVEDNAAAVRLAKNANTALVIRGAAQMVGDQVRITAQVIDANSGETIRTASVTGPTGDMLKLEDQLSAQLVRKGDQDPPSAPVLSATATPPQNPQNAGTSVVGPLPTPLAHPWPFVLSRGLSGLLPCAGAGLLSGLWVLLLWRPAGLQPVLLSLFRHDDCFQQRS